MRHSRQCYDVCVVGGGVMGSSTAYWLSRMQPSTRVAVIEKSPCYTSSSTSRSVGGIRVQFSQSTNIAMSRDSLQFIRDAQNTLGTPIHFTPNGYLMLADSAEGAEALEVNNSTQSRVGVDVKLLSPQKISRRFPWINVEDLTLGAWGGEGEGWVDPYMLNMAFRNRAIEQGVDYIDGYRATGFTSSSTGTLGQVQLESNTRESPVHVQAGVFVNAGGPYASHITTMALKATGVDGGVKLPVAARRRNVFVISCDKDHSPGRSCPLVVDPTGVYFRPECNMYLCGKSPDTHNDPECDPDENLDDACMINHDQFMDDIWPALANRVSVFESIKVMRYWAGHYEYNTVDQNAILGHHPDISNLIHINGFSGHGIQQAPAAGRGIAELILKGKYTSLDLTELGFGRLRATHKCMLEKNVV